MVIGFLYCFVEKLVHSSKLSFMYVNFMFIMFSTKIVGSVSGLLPLGSDESPDFPLDLL